MEKNPPLLYNLIRKQNLLRLHQSNSEKTFHWGKGTSEFKCMPFDIVFLFHWGSEIYAAFHWLLLLCPFLTQTHNNKNLTWLQRVLTKGLIFITHLKWLKDWLNKTCMTYWCKNKKKVLTERQAGYFHQLNWTNKIGMFLLLAFPKDNYSCCYQCYTLGVHYCIWRICWYWLSPWSSYVCLIHWLTHREAGGFSVCLSFSSH